VLHHIGGPARIRRPILRIEHAKHALPVHAGGMAQMANW
jgi:hypothetical protein